MQDIFFLVCGGLKGLPDSADAIFPLATIQTCIIHYADARVMPMWVADHLRRNGLPLTRSA